MRVTKIEIANVMGIEAMEIVPGAITVIDGANATGKTSVLEAIRAALGGGHDATLIRQGEQKGRVVIELDDGTRLTKEITEARSPLRLSHPELGAISRSQGYVSRLVDALGINPIDFLTAPKKRRVDLLLEAIPMTVPVDELNRIVGPGAGGAIEGHALEVIESFRKRMYDERTGLNRAAKEKAAAAAEMEKALPKSPDRTAAERNWEDVVADREAELSDFRAAARVSLDSVKEDWRGCVAAANEWAADEIEKIKRAAERRIREAEIARDKAAAEINAKYESRNQELSEKLAEARAVAKQFADAEKTREFIRSQTADAERLESESAQLTKAIDKLEGLKAELLADLPVEGLEVRDGDIFVDGIPFDRVNESRKIRLAIEIAKLRSGELGLVVIDGLERLDSRSYEEFRAQAEASGLQFIVTRVTDGDLAVSSSGGGA